MQTIKDFLSKYKIHVAVVGGALVIGTAYATCTVEPAASESVEEAATEEVSETTSSAPATESSNSEGNSSTENN